MELRRSCEIGSGTETEREAGSLTRRHFFQSLQVLQAFLTLGADERDFFFEFLGGQEELFSTLVFRKRLVPESVEFASHKSPFTPSGRKVAQPRHFHFDSLFSLRPRNIN